MSHESGETSWKRVTSRGEDDGKIARALQNERVNHADCNLGRRLDSQRPPKSGNAVAELREYAARRGWKIVQEYVDAGIAGSKDSRPALNRLMADACQRRFDAVLVWKLDRYGRSLRHLVNALAELKALGIAFISLRDKLDLGASC